MKPRERGDAGETLIEILMTVVILGTTVLAIVAALWTAISASAFHRQQTDADVAAKAYAEALRLTVSQMSQDDWCTAHSTYVPSPLPAYPTDWTGSVTASFGSCPNKGPISANVNSPQYRTATVTATTSGGVVATQTIVLTPSWCYWNKSGSPGSTC